MQLALVPGHRPSSPGVCSDGLCEYPIARILCSMILVRLPDYWEVSLHRRPDSADGLSSLIHGINASGVDAALSIHFNACEGPSPDRAYSCVYPGSDGGNFMADVISENLQLGIPRAASRSRPNLRILNDTTVPVCLDEPCYLDRGDHREKLERNLDLFATDYATAIKQIQENWPFSERKDQGVAGG